MLIRLGLVLKIVAFLLGCLCTAVLAFTLYVWLTLDTGKLESELMRQVAERSQRALRIEGGLQIALWPRPALRLAGATLSEAGTADVFAELGPARFELALKPLLWREAVIERIDIRGGRIPLTRQRDGHWNGEDLPAILDALTAPGGVLSLRLREVTLRQSRLQLRDESSGRELQLGDLLLRAPELEPGRGGPLHLNARIEQGQHALDGNLVLTGELLMHGEQGGFAVENLQGRFTGSLSALADARGQLGLARFDWSKPSNWQLGKLVFSLSGKQDGRPLDFSLELPQLRWEDGAPRASSVDLGANLGVASPGKDELASTLRLKLVDLAPAKGGFGARLNAIWQPDGKSDKKTTEGLSLQAPLRFDEERATWRLDDIQGELRLAAPWLRESARHLRLAGNASWRLASPLKGEDERPGRLSLDLAAGQDVLRTEARLADWLPLAGQLDLSAKRLDGDGLFDPAYTQTIALPLAALQRHTLNGRLRIDQLILGGLELSGIDSPYTWGGKRLALGELRLSQGGAKAVGKLDYDGASGQLTGQFKLDKLDPRALAAHAGLTVPLSGRADGSLGLEARGHDSLSLGSSLTQQWQLRYVLPVLEGVDLARSLRELREAWRGQKAAARLCAADERTELASLGLKARFAKHLLEIDQLEANASWVAFTATGRGEAASDSLALNTLVTPINPAIRSFSRDLADLKGIALPLLIGHNQGRTSVALTLQKQP